MRHLGRNLRTALLAVALLLGAQLHSGVWAQGGQRVLRPAEVIVMDRSGHQLLGYGQLTGHRLSLEVTQRVGDFVLLLIGPLGELERLMGSEDADGFLRLERADGKENLSLAAFFEGRDLELVMMRRGRVNVPSAAGGGYPDPDDGNQPTPSPPDDDDDDDRDDDDDDRDDDDWDDDWDDRDDDDDDDDD